MKIVFMGTPDFAVASLDALHKSQHEVVGVITVADKPAGRGKQLRPSPVKQYAVENNLNVLQPLNLKDESFLSELKALSADLFVVVAFRMLPEAVWQMPPKGTINLHGSLLPDYRGAAPINWAVMNGDVKTGATTFFIEKEIDTGNMIDRIEIDITEDMDAGMLHDKMMIEGAQLLIKTVDNIENGTATGTPQSSVTNQTFREAPKIFKETCQIDWTKDINTIYNHIRGLAPYPAAWTNLIDEEGNEKSLKIFKTVKSDNQLAPGTIRCNNKDLLEIGCQNGSLQILELQLSGKKRMDIKSFLNGVKLTNKHTCQ